MVTTRPLSRSLCRPLSRALVWLTDIVGEFASLLVDPAGADNSVLYTAKTAGAGGELVSIAYAAPAEQATTTVAVSTNAITVTAGTKARMMVTASGNPIPANTELAILSGEGQAASYSNTGGSIGISPNTLPGVFLTFEAGKWRLRWVITAGDVPQSRTEAVATSNATWPDGATIDGTTVTAGISNAAQVIAAVNATAAAAALVTASASGASTGPVAAVVAANLALPAPPEIPANALTLDGLVLTLAGETLTLN